MKFTLKDYQEEAVGKVLVNLKKASKRWREDGDKHAFSLTATTGAGKTVMAAAVFEALFHGDDNYDIEPDPGAVVIWFSDDPSLNEQSRYRLLEASDRLSISDLVVVQNTFQREALEPGKIYFLNTQKLSKSSLLVRGRDQDEEADHGPGIHPGPDAEQWVRDNPDMSREVSHHGDTVSVRDVLVHMVEEYARHCGHADLLRESIDGLIGEDPPS